MIRRDLVPTLSSAALRGALAELNRADLRDPDTRATRADIVRELQQRHPRGQRADRRDNDRRRP